MHSVSVDGVPVTPSKIVCAGRNYVRHIEELGNEVPDELVLFLKPNSAIGTTLPATRDGETLHYEGEIALLVRDGAFAAAAFGLDLTRRALQTALKRRGLPWERAKAFAGSALFGPFVSLTTPVTALALQLAVDGEVRQTAGVGLMIFKPDFILDEAERVFGLEDGDILLTGTPAGVGEVRAGARFAGELLADGEHLCAAHWQAQR